MRGYYVGIYNTKCIMNISSVFVEFVGTFIFVATILIATSYPKENRLSLAPLPIGIALTGLIFFAATTSGGHFNPAVTLAVLLKSSSSNMYVYSYILAQLLGGYAAYAFVSFA